MARSRMWTELPGALIHVLASLSIGRCLVTLRALALEAALGVAAATVAADVISERLSSSV